jgi:hypothetical protein
MENSQTYYLLDECVLWWEGFLCKIPDVKISFVHRENNLGIGGYARLYEDSGTWSVTMATWGIINTSFIIAMENISKQYLQQYSTKVNRGRQSQ